MLTTFTDYYYLKCSSLCSIINSFILDLKFIPISSKPESQEISFIVKCLDKCDQVDIRFSERKTYFNLDELDLYALENDKPRIKNGSCSECENLCASQNGTACHNVTTEGNQFYLTVYHDEPYVDSELAFINVNEVIPFGKKVSFFISY